MRDAMVVLVAVGAAGLALLGVKVVASRSVPPPAKPRPVVTRQAVAADPIEEPEPIAAPSVPPRVLPAVAEASPPAPPAAPPPTPPPRVVASPKSEDVEPTDWRARAQNAPPSAEEWGKRRRAGIEAMVKDHLSERLMRIRAEGRAITEDVERQAILDLAVELAPRTDAYLRLNRTAVDLAWREAKSQRDYDILLKIHFAAADAYYGKVFDASEHVVKMAEADIRQALETYAHVLLPAGR